MGRWKIAQTSTEPVEIVTLAEAKAAEARKTSCYEDLCVQSERRTRFAWGSSRKFV
ncbi:MAG: hypothetical protein IPP89_00480 [Saprospiraceae bacterium]|nr:hypothetical protein [Candidatus Brachybacter algidus]MBL0117485.1 hypothetical protein [Candidatus Brachybacter algidus]